jgi:hypothetical protein
MKKGLVFSVVQPHALQLIDNARVIQIDDEVIQVKNYPCHVGLLQSITYNQR